MGKQKKQKTEPNIKIRKLPRNQYGHCNIDPLLKYIYKYSFQLYNKGFTVIDLETKVRRKFDTVLDLINYLTQPGKDNLFSGGVPDFGIPIVENGWVNTHAPLLTGDDLENLDPYFTAVITVNLMGSVDDGKTKSGHFEVFYNKA